MVVGRAATSRSSVVAESSAHADASDVETVAEDAADARPSLVSGDAPFYPAAAEAAGVEVDVPVAILIGVDGSVEEAHARGHVGYGLEEAATRAVRSYRFTRASRRGRPVRVRMTWTVLFRLQ
jgi:TonB family protein